MSPKEIDRWITEHRSEFVRDYKKIVEAPSVSAVPSFREGILNTAKIGADYLRKIGAEVRVYETKGYPVIFGHIENKKGAPTVAIYNHLDVQPATKGRDGWTRDPFTFSEEGGRFYSRGTTDDKGPAMTALWGAKLALEHKIPINIEFIWELEEEIGSPNFAEFVQKAKNDIRAQSIVVSDTIWLARGKPAIAAGLRGLLTVCISLETGKKDVHSGLTGGAARNPITELAELISTCVDAKTGDIKIPGFEKTWKRPSKKEVEEFVASGFSVASFKKAHQLEKLRTDDLAEVTERIWARPTFEVHGIAGGYQDAGVKTIVPQKAEAKISFRLIPGQDPEEIFDLLQKHVRKTNPDCRLEKEGVLEPFSAPKEAPQIDMIREAFEFGFNSKAAVVREGGSIGAVVTINQALKIPVFFMGLSLPEDGYHGPDESFAWEQVQGGVKSFYRYFELLSQWH